MKKFKFLSSIAVVLISVMSFSCSKDIQEDFEQPESTATINLKSVPTSLELAVAAGGTQGNMHIPSSQFGNYTRWYKKVNTYTQEFNLYAGDWGYRGDGITKHARVEVHGGLIWNQGSTTHVFQATYDISAQCTKELCIGQIFEGSKGPQLMIHMKTDGRITADSRSNTNKTIGNWDGSPFKIRIECNGKNMKVKFNDVEKFTGTTEESQLGNTSARYHFRWGLYCNDPMPNTVNLKVNNIYRK